MLQLGLGVEKGRAVRSVAHHGVQTGNGSAQMHQGASGSGEGPVLLRLACAFEPEPRNPGTVRVTLSLVRKWQQERHHMDLDFGFDVRPNSDS